MGVQTTVQQDRRDRALFEEIKAVFEQAGLTGDARLIVAYSGGPDSSALLHLVRQFIVPQRIVVAHLDHGLRAQAAGEAQRAAETAAAWGLTFELGQAAVRTLAQKQGRSLEEAGRIARYDFLARVAHEHQAAAILTGHHADDQAETVLMHLLRGSGLDGLAGMEALGKTPGHPMVPLLRPLLNVSRARIERYCQDHNLKTFDDETNLDPALLRNRVRHELLPQLATYNERSKEHLVQMAELVRADRALLEELADREWYALLVEQDRDSLLLDRPGWQRLPLSLQRRTLRRAMQHVRCEEGELGLGTIEAAREAAAGGATGSQVALPDGALMIVGRSDLIFAANSSALAQHGPQFSGPDGATLTVPGSLDLEGGWRLTVQRSDWELDDVKENWDSWRAFVDQDRCPELRVRSRRPGERFQPLGMGGRSASVQDVMVDRRLNRYLRARWPIVATADHLVWLTGLHLDDRVKITPDTRHIVELRCEPPA